MEEKLTKNHFKNLVSLRDNIFFSERVIESKYKGCGTNISLNFWKFG